LESEQFIKTDRVGFAVSYLLNFKLEDIMKRRSYIALSSGFLIFLLSCNVPNNSFAHGIVGQRFFPATIAVDDPFVADEMDLLGYQYVPNPDPGDPTHTQAEVFWAGISKRLTRDIGIQVKAAYTMDHFDGDENSMGFQNIGFGIMDQMIKIPAHEFIFSSALNMNIGGTGTRGSFNHPIATPYSTIIPEIYFGYGFGDFPDWLGFLRPFAFTGTADLAIPVTDGSSYGGTADYSTGADYGLTIMYSTMYLQSFVKDIGLTKPFSRMIPIVEFTWSNNVNGPSQFTTPTPAYAYPGILWIGKYTEIGVEAVLPLNSATGSQPGVQVLFHVFLDDWMPQIFTRSISGEVLGPTIPTGP
jgi:hypothetical protein